jgi:23S rRNA (cytosine1962-C5)-methyltransferase
VAEDRAIITAKGVERLRAGHPWVYRSDLKSADASAGAVVRVLNEQGRFLGRAFYSDRSQISVRLITHEDVPVDRAFLLERIRQAAKFRDQVVSNSNAYRLVYGEGDRIPALIVDRYADYLVMQNLNQSTDRLKGLIVDVLVELFSPRGILERNDPKVRLLEGLPQSVSVLYGEVPEEVEIDQDGIRTICDLRHGQKTGAFLDQRENYQAAAPYARGEVLDCFSYQGGFALGSARRAHHVDAVDLSSSALSSARRNASLNSLSNISFHEANSFDLLKQFDDSSRRFDTVILDPPAFAKNKESLAAAIRGYKEINLRALKLLRPGGCLVTCSCSHHLPEAHFLQLLADAATDAHRTISIVDRRTQAKDHPVLLTVPETLYLKCLILRALS